MKLPSSPARVHLSLNKEDRLPICGTKVNRSTLFTNLPHMASCVKCRKLIPKEPNELSKAFAEDNLRTKI